MESVGIALVYIADLIFGDPEWLPHPVRWMGGLISLLDGRFKVTTGKLKERIMGCVLAFIVVGLFTFSAYLLIALSRKVSPILGGLVWIYLGYAALSIKDLRIKSKAVLKEVKKDALVEARSELSKIVGRDTRDLSKEEIVKATIESVAENTNDGIVAPLFYLFLGGPVLGIAYKAINTLDSMIGHKNERYVHLGWFSAKLDDVMNFIPARISGFLIAVSSFLMGKGFGTPFRIMSRDGRKHPSPNSGISEAAMAGALGVKLGGASAYRGKLIDKPYIGEDKRPAMPLLISEALKVSFITSLLALLSGVFLKWLI